MASKVNTIHRKQHEFLTYYPVVIIGAGESGIAAGCQLKTQLGTDQFRIFERRAGAGGVWYTSRYPGVAGDSPALCYSFSFNQKPNWTDLHPPGADIRQYLNDTIDTFRIRQNLRLNTDVAKVHWVEHDNEWELLLHHFFEGVGDLPTHERNRRSAKDAASVIVSKERIRAKVIISCVGALVEANHVPTVLGSEEFQGITAHSSNWEPTTSVRDKHVIVVGTGSSATQIVPALIKPEFGAKSVLNIMRSPPWVEPGFSDPKGTKNWNTWVPRLTKAVPGYQALMRKIVFATMELEFQAIFTPSTKSTARRQAKAVFLLEFLRKTAPKEYHEQLTPDYEVFCKRRVMGEDWFRSLNDERVDLCTLPLTRLTRKTAVLGPGRMYPDPSNTKSKVPNEELEVPVDVVIFANGYDAGNWLHPLEIYGRSGVSLHDVWTERGGPQAYLGQAMDGFPNFFIVHGPNTITGHSSVILASEMMIQHALPFIRLILEGIVDVCEVKKEAELAWTKDIQSRLRDTVWNSGGCRNWYNRNGWNSTVYPRSQVHFAWRCKNPRFGNFNAVYTKKGIASYQRRLGNGLPHRVRALPTVTTAAPSKGNVSPDTLSHTGSTESVFEAGKRVDVEVQETHAAETDVSCGFLNPLPQPMTKSTPSRFDSAQSPTWAWLTNRTSHDLSASYYESELA